MEAAAHPQQDARLAALRSYDILDTKREPDFDDVAHLASAICGAPIAVVNFIDAERQWFKAEVGLGVRETPLAASLCSHVILENDFVEIPDTLNDPRMVDNPLCCGDPGLRFYAGALLRSDGGLLIGTLCVLDWEPRTLTDLQRKTIKVLARQVMAQLDLRRALRDAAVLRQEVDHRVKNSLQSIEALARMSRRNASEPAAQNAMLVMEQRIAAVSRVHGMLYESNAGNAIGFADYAEQLIEASRMISPANVRLVIQVEPITLASGQAGALGLMINEFVANSLKHAFPGGMDGQVSVGGEALDDGWYRMTLNDTGVGFDVSGQGEGGLGMVVFDAICSQLECRTDLRSSDAGLSIVLEFLPTAPSGA